MIMSESRSELEPSHLKLILDLFDSAGYVHANRSGLSDFAKLFDGLSWCISISSANTHLNSTPKIDSVEEIEDALKLLGCPHALQATQIEDLDYISIYPAVQWLVHLVKTKQHNGSYVKEKRAVVLNDLEHLRERIDEAGVDSVVQELASLLKTSKALERKGSNIQSECKKKQSRLISEITELEEKLRNGNVDDDLCNHLDHSICDLSATLKYVKRDLACKLRESVSLKRELDDMPIAEEIEQYKHRFSELNVHIQDRLHQTRKYYATYNALLEIKDLMLKEISLLNSLNSQFQDAIGNPAGHTKLIDSMEAILRGIQQKLEKVQPGLQVEHKTFDTLREQYTAAIANQRCYATLFKTFQEECKKNERLKEESAKNGSSRGQSSS